MRAVAIAAVALASIATFAWAQERTASPAGAEVYIISPKDGATVKSPVTIEFGLKGMGVAPAGVKFENTGHHHLLIDTELPPPGEPIPNNRNHLHFGGGQTEVKIELPPGRHTLQLILGDADHVPFEPSIVSQQITVIVP